MQQWAGRCICEKIVMEGEKVLAGLAADSPLRHIFQSHVDVNKKQIDDIKKQRGSIRKARYKYYDVEEAKAVAHFFAQWSLLVAAPDPSVGIAGDQEVKILVQTMPWSIDGSEEEWMAAYEKAKENVDSVADVRRYTRDGKPSCEPPVWKSRKRHYQLGLHQHIAYDDV